MVAQFIYRVKHPPFGMDAINENRFHDEFCVTVATHTPITQGSSFSSLHVISWYSLESECSLKQRSFKFFDPSGVMWQRNIHVKAVIISASKNSKRAFRNQLFTRASFAWKRKNQLCIYERWLLSTEISQPPDLASWQTLWCGKFNCRVTWC